MRWRLLKLDIPYLIGELFIVILGVSIALAADQWRQSRNNNDLANQYVSRLVQDLDVDIIGWERADPYLQSKIDALDHARDWIQSPKFDDQSVSDFLDNLTFGTRRAYGVGGAIERTTIEELTSSGQLNLLRDVALRQQILAYYARAEAEELRISSRVTHYAPTIYELIPRDPEFVVSTNLETAEKARIARLAQEFGLEGLINA